MAVFPVKSVLTRIGLSGSIPLSVLVVGLAVGTVGLGYASWYAKESLRHIIGLHFHELARHSADKVSLMLAKEIEWVERFAALPQVREALHEGVRLKLDDPALQRFKENQSEYFRSLAIVDRSGGLLGGETSEGTRIHYTQQPWWMTTMQQGKPWAGDLLVDGQGRGYWEMVVPVRDEEHTGPVLGVLKVAIGVDALLGRPLQTSIGKTGHIMLLGPDGVVLICPLLPPGLHHRIAELAVGGGREHADMRTGWREVSEDGHGGHGAIVGFAPVVLAAPIVQERIWVALVRQDPAETYQPASILFWKLAAFWSCVIGVLVWLGTKFADLKKVEQAHHEVARSEAHYRTLWNHAVDAKVIVDKAGIVRDANRRAEVKLGRGRKDLLGIDAAGLFLESDRPRFCEAVAHVREGAGEGNTAAIHVPTAGGTLTMDLDILPIALHDDPHALLLQLSDVTEKLELAQQLLRSERLASLSQFASMFAHDIRNPLAGMKKTLELLLRRGRPLGDQRDQEERVIEDLQFTTELLLGMINDMLDVYQESYSGLPITCSTFSARDLLQDVTRLFKSEADAKGVEMRLVISEEALMLTADRRRLQRVVMNLVHNALKYAPAFSVIRLSIARRDRRHHDPLRRQGMVSIRVEDEGPGVDVLELPHVFELFFRKKDGRDPRIGRGLGLHFCRLVAEAHGGRIWAENREEGGARFSVEVPIDASALKEQVCQSSL